MDIVNNLLSEMLTPLKVAEEALSTALQLAGKGVDWSGQALGEAGSVIHSIELKTAALQEALRGSTSG